MHRIKRTSRRATSAFRFLSRLQDCPGRGCEDSKWGRKLGYCVRGPGSTFRLTTESESSMPATIPQGRVSCFREPQRPYRERSVIVGTTRGAVLSFCLSIGSQADVCFFSSNVSFAPVARGTSPLESSLSTHLPRSPARWQMRPHRDLAPVSIMFDVRGGLPFQLQVRKCPPSSAARAGQATVTAARRSGRGGAPALRASAARSHHCGASASVCASE